MKKQGKEEETKKEKERKGSELSEPLLSLRMLEVLL